MIAAAAARVPPCLMYEDPTQGRESRREEGVVQAEEDPQPGAAVAASLFNQSAELQQLDQILHILMRTF